MMYWPGSEIPCLSAAGRAAWLSRAIAGRLVYQASVEALLLGLLLVFSAERAYDKAMPTRVHAFTLQQASQPAEFGNCNIDGAH